MAERADLPAGAGKDRDGGHEAYRNHCGIYAEYATSRPVKYQRVGSVRPGKSLTVPTKPFEQTVDRMPGFDAPAPPRSHHGGDLDRGQRVEEGECRLGRCAAC
jgi:hypothetical protein